MPPAGRDLPSDVRVARILERIRAIPEGFVRSYGDIDPVAPRLVGRVLAETDEEVPWHRVVRSDGSVAKGATQLRLLRGEGVPLRGRRVDMAQARIPEYFDVENEADGSRVIRSD